MSSSKIYNLICFDLLPGVTEADFEAFVADPGRQPYVPPGFTWRVLKGDRGERKGRYAFLMEIDSIETRNHVVPVEGQGVADQDLIAKWQPYWDAVGKLTTWPHSGLPNTDYVELKSNIGET
jgi:hypothetical protein